jgi:site-specific recombinase XerD
MSELAPSPLSVAMLDWLVDTPLELIARTYVEHLIGHGYMLRTRQAYVACLAHFSHWLALEHIELADIDETVISCFVDRHLPRCRCRQYFRCSITSNSAALGHLLEYLRVTGKVAAPPRKPPTLIDQELAAFEHYLRKVRGMGATTCYYRLNSIRAFLSGQFGTRPVLVSRIAPEDIERFLTRYTNEWTAASRNTVCVSLRSYLRFKAIGGEPADRLVAAIPKIATGRLVGLPHTVSAEELEQLFSAFDRNSAVGRRDFAIAHLLVDLGLRAGEVPRLTLEDIDWRQGTIHVHTKGRRMDLLPLPAALGRAITQYLRHGRPSTTSRVLFMRHRAPLDAPITAAIVRKAICGAARRCGIAALTHGPHRLRHTAAQRLLENGATLKTVADFLRHRSLDTTKIYSKIDLRSLAEVALPWPGRLA